MGGEDASDSSTFTYDSYASPREDSGSHARRIEAALALIEEVEDEVRGRNSPAGVFCCMRAMKPGMLSFEEGVG